MTQLLCSCIIISCLLVSSYSESIRIAFGSCARLDLDTSIFNTIASRNPDMWVWTGDITYLDYKSYDQSSEIDVFYVNFAGVAPAPKATWEETWNSAKSDSNYQNLLNQNITIIGIWDDHDYGKNNGDGLNNQDKDYAQELLYNFLDIPENHPKRSQPGVYEYYQKNISLSPSVTKTIDMILLDARYFWNIDGQDNILGETQWNWLEDILANQLNDDNHELTLLFSPIQISPVYKDYQETWGNDANLSYQRLLNLLLTYNTSKRLLLVTGDLHQGQITKTQCINNLDKTQKQNIYELTSSGLTHASGDKVAFIEKMNDYYNEYLTYDGIYLCHYWGRNFGEINIEWQLNTNTNEFEIVNINGSVFDINGKEQCTMNIPLWSDNIGENDIDYDPNGLALAKLKNYTCYGGVKQYLQSDIDSIGTKENMFLAVLYGCPVMFLFYYFVMIPVWICKCANCCGRCTSFMDNKKND
eukprot:509147_1